MSKKYMVVRDTREKEGQGWIFSEGGSCSGMVKKKLLTGDYSLVGLEDKFCIERKGTVKEFAQNIVQGRFEAELKRMMGFANSFVILEFDMGDMLSWPNIPGMTKEEESTWVSKISRWFLLQRFWELQIDYPSVRFIFVGRWGREVSSSLFKRMASSSV